MDLDHVNEQGGKPLKPWLDVIDGIKDIDLVNFENEETTYPSVRRGQGSLSFRKMPGAIRLELDLGNILFDTDLDCILEALTYELST